MTQAVAQILKEVEQLSGDERADLADRLAEGLLLDPDSSVARAQISEVQRRIADVEAGTVELIPGDEALAYVRQLVASASSAI